MGATDYFSVSFPSSQRQLTSSPWRPSSACERRLRRASSVSTSRSTSRGASHAGFWLYGTADTPVAVLLGFVDQIIPYSPSHGTGSRTELLPAQEEASGSGRRYSTFGRSAPNISPQLLSPNVRPRDLDDNDSLSDVSSLDGDERPQFDRAQVVRALKTQVWSGALIGLAAASVVGAIVLYIVSPTLA